MQRTTIQKWELGDARVTVMPETVEAAGGAKVTGYVLGIESNPMTREQLVELREVIATVLEESPAPTSVATLDPKGGIVA